MRASMECEMVLGKRARQVVLQETKLEFARAHSCAAKLGREGNLVFLCRRGERMLANQRSIGYSDTERGQDKLPNGGLNRIATAHNSRLMLIQVIQGHTPSQLKNAKAPGASAWGRPVCPPACLRQRVQLDAAHVCGGLFTGRNRLSF